MAQIVAAKVALGRQLHALGILPDAKIDDETPVMDLLSHMCHGEHLLEDGSLALFCI